MKLADAYPAADLPMVRSDMLMAISALACWVGGQEIDPDHADYLANVFLSLAQHVNQRQPLEGAP